MSNLIFLIMISEQHDGKEGGMGSNGIIETTQRM